MSSSTAAFGSSVLGYPRIGPRRELKARPRVLLARHFGQGRTSRGRQGTPGIDLERIGCDGIEPGSRQHLLLLRSRARQCAALRRSAGAVQAARGRPRAARFLLHDGPRPPGLPASRAGALLRYELLLPSARDRREHGVLAQLGCTSRRVRTCEGARHRIAPRHHGARLAASAFEGRTCHREVRSELHPLDLLDARSCPSTRSSSSSSPRPVRPVFSWTSLRSPRIAPPRS